MEEIGEIPSENKRKKDQMKKNCKNANWKIENSAG
jgi:hypothetical protein